MYGTSKKFCSAAPSNPLFLDKKWPELPGACEDYDVYARFPADDNVPFGVRYVIIHEPQETAALAENEYIHSLKHHNIEGMPWLGNLLVFKTHWGMEVTHIEEKDLSLVKRLITL